MGQIAIPSSTASSASNTVKYLKVGTSGGTIYMGEVKVFPSDEDIVNMKDKCLTLVAWDNTTFTFTPTSGQVLSYSVDGGAYTALPSTGGSVSVSGGQEVSWSGTAVPVVSASTTQSEIQWGIGKFSSTGKYHVEGNAMSLLYGSSYKTATSLSGKNYALVGLFSGNTTLMTSEHMVLPPTTLVGSCYRSLFKGCTNMTKCPELPATTLGATCYLNMFLDCSKLLVAPKLPADTIPGYAYYGMFRNCSSLAKAPELPATTIVVGNDTNQYSRMFAGCTSLTEAPELPALTIPSSGYSYMFSGCTKLVIGPNLPATSFTGNGQHYAYMFANDSKLETVALALPAETLKTSGYTGMFSGCTKLNRIKCLATDISASACTSGWTSGVAASGTFIKDASMTGWTSGVNGIPTGWTIKNDYGNVKYPLTFIARENCTFNFVGLSGNTLSCSTDDGVTWSAVPSTGVSVTAGNTVMWRGSCSGATAGSGATNSGIGHFEVTGSFDVEGNIMSLLFNDNFSGQTSLSNKGRVFSCLFSGCTGMTNAENLLLPATELTGYCYNQMFRDCTSLVTAPELPAMTIPLRAYAFMFVGCSSLTEAPELPATQLTSTSSVSAYTYMFSGCTSLIKPPSELPMTTIYSRCYSGMFCGCSSLTYGPDILAPVIPTSGCAYMFSGCTSLKYVKCLATDISANSATTKWMTGVATGGTFVKDPTMTGWTRGANGIPTNWKDSDYLTFIALEDDVKFRFNYPISKESTNKLSYSLDDGETWTDIASTIYTPPLKKGEKIRWKGTCVGYGFYGIGTFEATGNFNAEGNIMSLLYEDDYATQVSLAGKDNIFVNLFQDNENLINTSDMILPATTLSMHCYYYMFNGCTSLTTAPELPATTLAYYCYYYMFNGCTSLTTAPVLPATELTTACYSYMFSGCTSLNYIKAMFTTTPSTSYTRDWVKGVASSGTFVKNSAATWTTTGTNAVPTGWTIETASS